MHFFLHFNGTFTPKKQKNQFFSNQNAQLDFEAHFYMTGFKFLLSQIGLKNLVFAKKMPQNAFQQDYYANFA